MGWKGHALGQASGRRERIGLFKKNPVEWRSINPGLWCPRVSFPLSSFCHSPVAGQCGQDNTRLFFFCAYFFSFWLCIDTCGQGGKSSRLKSALLGSALQRGWCFRMEQHVLGASAGVVQGSALQEAEVGRGVGLLSAV